MAQLRISLLGYPQVMVDDQPVKIKRRKAVALLAYLAVTGQRHSREALATLLWPDYDRSSAFAYLRRTLWALNQTPIAGWLDMDRESVALEGDSKLWVDVILVRETLSTCQMPEPWEAQSCLVCVPQLVAAVGHYQGDFMQGFSIEDSPGFDEWLFFEAESLRYQLVNGLEFLVHCYTAQDNFDAAIEYARKWVSFDSLSEKAHYRLMDLYARNGQRAMALHQYDECVRILRTQVNTEPTSETIALYKQIRAGREPTGPQSQLQPPPTVSHQSPMQSISAPFLGVPAPGYNLPVPPTPFIGREDERRQIHNLLVDAACRLLTLTGPGGMGKTRLAIQVTQEHLDSFADGVCFVSLASLASHEFLVSAIADALSFPFFQRESEAPLTQLLNYLREKHLLLILDNFEHLMDGVSVISDILGYAENVRVLVTSRERLNLRGEWVIELGGLRLPGVNDGPQSLDLQTYDAVQLFAESARRVSGGFALDVANLEDVLRICRLVEGIPLGIELAAAWTRLLSCAEIVSEIEQGIDFLSTTMRDLPARHQSLRAVFEHSWTLLSATDREQFCKLAIFRGGFTREAAREIANASLQDLSVLVDKSLLRRTWSGRYEMLVVLRQYAEEKLKENPELYASVQALHSRYYVDYLVRLEPDLKGHKQVAALGALTADLENVRRAWHWILDNHRFDELRQCFNTLNLFYDIRSLPQEGFEVFALAATALRQFVEQHSDVGDAIRALLGEMLSNQGRFAGRIYRYDVARNLLREALEILEPLGDSSALAFANLYALTALLFPMPQEQKAKLEKSVVIFRSIGDRWAEAITLSILGEYTYYWHAGFDVSLNYMQQSLEIAQDLGDRWGISKTLFAMGNILQAYGKRREAQECYAESLECRRALRDTWGIAITLDYMGYVTRRLGEYEEARELHAESLAISRDIGDYLGIGGSLDNLGLVAYDLGDYTPARDYFEQGLVYRRLVSEKSDDVAYSLEHLGDVAAATGDYDAALDYYAQSLAIYSEIWANHPRRGRCLERRGWLFVLLGEVSKALSDFRQALQLLSGVDNVSFYLPVFHGFIKIWLQAGKVPPAVELLGFLWQHPALSYQLQLQVEDSLNAARSLLSPGDLESALACGEQLSLEDAISLVMED